MTQGQLASFYGPDLTPYTSVRAHPSTGGPVKQLLFHDRGVLSVAPTSVHLVSRRGLTKWHLEYEPDLQLSADTDRNEDMRDLRCIGYMGKENAFVAVAGCQDTMLKIDIEKGAVVSKVRGLMWRLLLRESDSHRA